MKHPVNFRLSTEALQALAALAAARGLSRTALLEEAICGMAAVQTPRRARHPLSRFAGAWKDQDVEALLAEVRRARRNKRRAPSS